MGDVGYKTLTKYCSELVNDNGGSVKHQNRSLKIGETSNGNLPNLESIGVVIVRDIVSKSVLVQFRAHKSPICALAFDPSGILLVTASVHGHSINVFQIMPSFSGNSSGSEVTGTCIHLYRLQRGITNAVIQDISFCADSEWIMISSSRGTSHLFSISPYEGMGGQKFHDVLYQNGSSGSETTAHWPDTLATSRINNQGLIPSGRPIKLFAVGRIKNGSNGWKAAVSGTAAAATGRVTPFAAIATVFHNCKDRGLYEVMNPSRTKFYLLVFSPSGCLTQYVLHHSAGDDSGINVSGLGVSSHGSLHEADSRLVIEALQKWDVCHKRTRRERGDNIDVYGHGNGERTKVFKKVTKKGMGIYPEDSVSDMIVKDTVEENIHRYISESELQMHTAQVPLWARSKIHFQLMVGAYISNDDNSALGGEIDIERVPVLTVEARTKDLIPVFDYFQTFIFGQPRVSSLGSSLSESGMCQKSDMSDDGRHSGRTSCSSLDDGLESATAADFPNGLKGTHGGGLCPSEIYAGFVSNSMDSANMTSSLKSVSTREGVDMETQRKLVNNKESSPVADHLMGYAKETHNIG